MGPAPLSRRCWLETVNHSGVSRNARHVGLYIVRFESFPLAFPKIETVADAMGVSYATAYRGLRELREASLLNTRAVMSRGGQVSNDYYCVLPSMDVGNQRTFEGAGPSLAKCPSLDDRREKREKQQNAHPPAPACNAVPPAAAASSVAPVPSVAVVAPVPPVAPPEAPRSSGGCDPAPHPPQPPLAPPGPVLGAAKMTSRATSFSSVALAPLVALPGGRGAARVLARSGLTPAQQQQVIDRVLAYHRDKGVQDAARFIHGPIADVREGEVVAAEKRAAVEADWDVGVRAVSKRIAEQRTPCFVSPAPLPPPPPCDPLETEREGIVTMLKFTVSGIKRAEFERQLREVEAKMAEQGLVPIGVPSVPRTRT